jgi:hypothetical protein
LTPISSEQIEYVDTVLSVGILKLARVGCPVHGTEVHISFELLKLIQSKFRPNSPDTCSVSWPAVVGFTRLGLADSATVLDWPNVILAGLPCGLCYLQ